MKVRLVLKVLSLIGLVVSAFMLFPMAVALWDGVSFLPFALSLLCGMALSLLLWFLGKRGPEESLGIREGVGSVTFAWVMASGIGALPLWFSGAAPRYVDAFFETMSGFTTTGATILTDIESLPRGILLWRSLTHWMGGMGIIVLGLAVLPFLGMGGMELYKAEVPGPTPEKLTPRLQETALRLWGIYVLMTLMETFFLFLGGMEIFDAFAHSCSTIATGGFSTKNASIAHFHSPYIEWVITVFMFASGVNFSLYFFLLAGRAGEMLRDEELRAYALLTAAASLSVAALLSSVGIFVTPGSALRHAAFHVVSVMTTTGFVASDYNHWPEFARFLFFILTIVGACAGSTGGGCKVVRFLLMGRRVRGETLRLLHPRAVVAIRLNGRPVARTTLDATAAFLMLYALLLFLCSLVVTAFPHPRLDFLTSLTGVATCLSNVGPGLNALGPVENFSWLPDGVKWIFSFCMLAGRLELFAPALLFLPGAWVR